MNDNGRMMTNSNKTGFTLIEILIALFVMAVGIIGVMSAFPVGIEATREAVDNAMVCIIGKSAIDQMQVYMNTSEIFDSRPGVYKRYYTASSGSGGHTVAFVQSGGRPVSANYNANFTGFYLNILYGPGTGRVMRISSASGNMFSLDGSDPPLPNLNEMTKFTVTRYGFPHTWSPIRVARVSSVGGGSVGVRSILRRGNLGWRGGEWRGTGRNVRFYCMFTSGPAKGRVYQVTSNGSNSVSLRTGRRSLAEDDRVRVGDTILIMGTRDIRPCTYPPNFGQSTLSSWGTPPTVQYYLSQNQADQPDGIVRTSLYSWVCIISDAGGPQPAPTGNIPPAGAARLDVIVYKGYSLSGTNRWRELPSQPASIGYVTAYVSPL